MITYEVKDVVGNTAILSFKIKSEKPATTISKQPSTLNLQSSTFKYNTANHFENGSVILDAPASAFYDSFPFRYDSARRIPNTFSPVHHIHDKYTPVHDYITLSLKPVNLPEGLRPKALVVKIKDDGIGYASAGGNWENNGYVTTRIREFGDYSIAVDTIPPNIKAVQPEIFTKLAGQKYVKLVISDELSGIASYRGTLNGKWILMDYDAKNKLLVYTIDTSLLPGKNTFILEVRDGKNNRSIFAATFIL